MEKSIGQKVNYLFKSLLQNSQSGNLSFSNKFTKVSLFSLLITAGYLFIGCGSQNDIPDINNVMGAINQYEQGILEEIPQLQNSNRLVSANSDIRDMTWLLVWDESGDILIETSTDSEDKVYNFADAIKRNGTYVLASRSDLNNPENLSENETFRVLEFEYSLQEVKGRILRADKQMMIYMRDAVTNQTAFTENTAPVEAFFKLSFARATHSYSIDSNSQEATTLIDQLMQGRQAYVFISNLYWTGINSGLSLPGLDLGLNRGNNYLGPSGNMSFSRSTTPSNSGISLEGKVDVSIDLLSLTDSDYRIINIFFQQSARDFQHPNQLEGVDVVLTLDSSDQDLSDFGSVYLRQKTLNPFHFIFHISASQLTTSINVTSNISNLVFIDPFEDVGIQRGLISQIGVKKKDRGFINTITRPFRWLGRGVGRVFGRN